MPMVLPIIVLLLVLSAVVAVGTRRRLRERRESARHDMTRIGDGDDLPPREAARRAQGNSAWIRFGPGL